MSDLPKLATYVSAHDLATKPRRADWLISSVIERGSFALLFGDPGMGKSFLALDWSAAVATGLDWLGKPVQRGSVVYICGEGFSGMGRRLAAWSRHRETPLDDASLYVSKYGENFLDAKAMAATIEELRDVPQPIGLIVVDTYARATPGGNEDRAVDVGEFVSACDNLRQEFEGATVLVLHHSGHGDKSRAKGSIALKGAVDFEAGLMATSEDGVVKLVCTKLKDGEPFPDTFLRFESVDLGDGVTSAVLTECDTPSTRSGRSKKVNLSANDKLFLAALGLEPIDEANVRSAFKQRHPSGNKDTAAKTYARVRRRGLQREWFSAEGKVLIPNTTEIMRNRTDGQGQT